MSENAAPKPSYPTLPPIPILHTILNSGFGAIAVMDSQGRFIYMNQQDADLYQEDPDRMIGQTPERWVGPETFATFRKNDQAVLDGGVVVHLEPYLRQDSQGQQHWFDTIKIPFKLEGFEGPVLLVIHRDITEIKKAELERDRLQEQVHQQERSLVVSQLAAQMAHQLNGLMMVAMNLADTLLPSSDNPEVALNHQQLVQSIAKASFQIKQFQFYGDRFQASPIDFEIMGFVRSALPRVLELFDSQISAEIQAEEDPCYVHTDNLLLEHLILTLLTKIASDTAYTFPISLHISVERLTDPQSEVQIKITDHGPKEISWSSNGRDHSKQKGPSLESPFLELQLIHRILNLINVKLSQSYLPEIGNQWILHLPLLQSAPHVPVNPLPSPGLPLEGRQILVVDDEPLLLKMLQTILTKLGANVHTAEHAAAAWRYLESELVEQKLDIVISDLIMPGEENGIDLRRKCTKFFPQLPFVLMSGEKFEVFGSLDDLPPFTLFLPKPAKISALVEAINRLLAT